MKRDVARLGRAQAESQSAHPQPFATSITLSAPLYLTHTVRTERPEPRAFAKVTYRTPVNHSDSQDVTPAPSGTPTLDGYPTGRVAPRAPRTVEIPMDRSPSSVSEAITAPNAPLISPLIPPLISPPVDKPITLTALEDWIIERGAAVTDWLARINAFWLEVSQ